MNIPFNLHDDTITEDTSASFWKNLKPRNELKSPYYLGNNCLFHA